MIDSISQGRNLKRDVVAALLLSIFTVHSEAANLKEIVEAARAGIAWRDFEKMAGVERMNAAVRIGSSLAGARPREAWTWAKDLPPSDDREFLMRGILL